MAHSYDADGNKQAVNGQSATYDWENRLAALGSSATYTYDADGDRVQVSASGTATNSLVDASLAFPSVAEERDGSGSLLARYDSGDDLVRMDRGGGTYYYLFDGLGSTRALADGNGNVTDGYAYDAFGEGLAHSPASAAGTANPFLFDAQQWDGPTQAYFLRARYYNQASGRFLSQDPYGGSNSDPVTLHRYLYAGDDPVNHIDPSGQVEMSDVVFALAVTVALGAITAEPLSLIARNAPPDDGSPQVPADLSDPDLESSLKSAIGGRNVMEQGWQTMLHTIVQKVDPGAQIVRDDTDATTEDYPDYDATNILEHGPINTSGQDNFETAPE
ncbi:MAG: RHS repeat-associated core domain-containing protein [Armatimonadetes bacterium]|nr:RHS repeat-associated core domain-containing protein [Armatimonadota bacterium]